MSIFNKLFKKNSNDNNDYHKEELRGTIKEIMKTRGLRSVNINNYLKWKNCPNIKNIHSIKLSPEDGYLYMFGYKENEEKHPGNIYEKPTIDMYEYAYSTVKEALQNEKKMPYKLRRNILVKMWR